MPEFCIGKLSYLGTTWAPMRLPNDMEDIQVRFDVVPASMKAWIFPDIRGIRMDWNVELINGVKIMMNSAHPTLNSYLYQSLTHRLISDMLAYMDRHIESHMFSVMNPYIDFKRHSCY